MTVGGAGPWIRRPTGGGSGGTGLQIAVALWEGQVILGPSEGYTPFDFLWTAHGGASGDGDFEIQYDPGGWLNPSTWTAANDISDDAAAYSTILIPSTGLYWSEFAWKMNIDQPSNPGDFVDASVHIFQNGFLHGAVGHNYNQGPINASFDGFVSIPPVQSTGIYLLTLTAGDVLGIAAFNNSSSSGINFYQCRWTFGPVGEFMS